MTSARCVSRLISILMLNACHFGGPSGDPAAYVSSVDDGGDTGSPEADNAMDMLTMDADIVNETSVDTSVRDSASADALGGDSGDGGDSATCAAPASVPVCDPLTNTGCTLLQCDVDITMSTPTGVCVLGAAVPAAEGAACTQASGSTACQAELTCFGGSCRRICFCDSDCQGDGGAVAACCSDSYSTTGFKLCAACP
jgi:hypothetical protein